VLLPLTLNMEVLKMTEKEASDLLTAKVDQQNVVIQAAIDKLAQGNPQTAAALAAITGKIDASTAALLKAVSVTA
jgi:hypothetical protein